MRLFPTTAVLAAAAIGCSGRRPEPPKSPITVFAAASLARPLAALADSFQRRTGNVVHVELGGSMEHSRKITELGRTPEVLMLVDDEVIARLLPVHLDWYVRYATNRIVVAYTDRSRDADSITPDNWWSVLGREGVTVGRADPAIAPAGRHALDILQRAEAYYHRRGLTDRLVSHASLRYVRPNAAELAALLETGNVDYILDYESVARQYGFRFVALPSDLAVAVLYGLSVPRQAPHFREGVAFAAYVLSDDGKRILRDAHVDVLSLPVAVGSAVPLEISELVRTAAAENVR